MKRYFIIALLLMISSSAFSQVSNTLLRKREARELSNKEYVIDSVDNESQASVLDTDELDIFIFGSGGIRTTALGGNSEGGTGINGALGAQIMLEDHTEFLISYSVNDFSVLTIENENDFGKNVLAPDLNGRAFNLSFTRYFNQQWGLNVETQIADSKWKIGDQEVEASPVLAKLNALYTPFGNISRGDNFISVGFTGGVSVRSLLGNIRNEDALRQEYFGTTAMTFPGIELGGYLALNNTKVFINVPVLNAKDQIDGLTGGQVMIGVQVSGNVFKL